MRISSLIVALLLAGCGGSGDSQQLAVNDDNALYIAATTSLSNDTLTGLAQLAVLAHDELNAKPRTIAATKPVICKNGSQASQLIVHTVSDTYYLSADQRFSILFNQCQLAELDAIVSGELDVLIRDLTLDGYSLEISTADYLLTTRNLQLIDDTGAVQVSAEINSRYSASNNRYSYSLTPAGSNLILTLPNAKREQFSNFNTQLVLDNLTGRYQLNTRGTLQSDELAGNVSVTTAIPLSGQLQRLPNEGELRYQANGNSTMLLTSIASTTGIMAKVTLPELGLEGQIDWLDLSTGASWQKTGLAKDFIWRRQTDFVNLEAEWLEPEQTMQLALLPNQPLKLHFSDVVTELGGYGSQLALTAVDDQGLRIFGVPEIDLNIQISGTVVQLQPATPLLAGYRYRLVSFFANNNGRNLAFVPTIYAQLVEELSASINMDATLFNAGQEVEVYPTIRSDLGPAFVNWQTDETVVEQRPLPNQGIAIKVNSAPTGSYVQGILSLNVSNARGNQLQVQRPYAIIDDQLTDYFFNSIQPLTAAGTASILLAPINTQNDIGNDTGIYTGVSGLSADGQSWSLWLRTGDSGILQPGSYVAGSEDNISEPHIEVIIAKRSCKTQQANFNVHQVEYQVEYPFVTKLNVDYELQCLHNQQSYKYQGQIRFQRGF